MPRKNGLLFPSVITFIVGAAYLAMGVHRVGHADPRQAEAAVSSFIVAAALIVASIAVFVIGRRLSNLRRHPPGGGPSDLELLQADAWKRSGINPANSGRAKRIIENPDDKYPIG